MSSAKAPAAAEPAALEQLDRAGLFARLDRGFEGMAGPLEVLEEA
jgi:hypothetical protein